VNLALNTLLYNYRSYFDTSFDCYYCNTLKAFYFKIVLFNIFNVYTNTKRYIYKCIVKKWQKVLFFYFFADCFSSVFRVKRQFQLINQVSTKVSIFSIKNKLH